jgi:hypothetical protein
MIATSGSLLPSRAVESPNPQAVRDFRQAVRDFREAIRLLLGIDRSTYQPLIKQKTSRD